MFVANNSQVGFTLVESIAAMMIISVAAIAIASSLGVAFQHSSDGMVDVRSQALAKAYFAEMTARRFDEAAAVGGVPPCSLATVPCSVIGPDGESRDQFDDVDDYHGLNEQPPRDHTGAVMAGYAGYRVSVGVEYPDPTQVTAWGLDHAWDAKLVTIQVINVAGIARTYTRVFGNY